MEELIDCPLGALEGCGLQVDALSFPPLPLIAPAFGERRAGAMKHVSTYDCGRIMIPKDTLTPRTSAYVMLHGKGEFRLQVGLNH